MCCAYWALFSAARSLCMSICFSLTRSHILNGAMPMAERGMRTQIQLAILFIQARPFVSSQIYRRSGFSTGHVVIWLNGLAARYAPDRRAQRLDLRRRLGSAVGDDLFENPDALLELVAARCILRGFFGGVERFD